MSREGRERKKEIEEVRKDNALLDQLNRQIGIPPSPEGGGPGPEAEPQDKELPPPDNEPPVRFQPVMRIKDENYPAVFNIIWRGAGIPDPAYRSQPDFQVDLFQGYGEIFTVMPDEGHLALLLVDRINLKHRRARLQLFDAAGARVEDPEVQALFKERISEALRLNPYIMQADFEQFPTPAEDAGA